MSKKIIFMKKARDYFNKQIEKEENKQKRQLTNEERRENRKKNRKKAKLIATVATSVALGAIGGSEGRHLLDSRHTIEVEDKKEHSVEINAKETDGVIHISDAKHVFVNGLHVGENELEVVRNMNGNLETNTRREVTSLRYKPEQVSTYIKTILADEYNQKNGTNVTSDDITIHREKASEKVKERNENSSNDFYESSSFLRIFEEQVDPLSSKKDKIYGNYNAIIDQGINLLTVTVNKENKEESTVLAYVENARRNYKKAPIYFPKDLEKGQETLEKLLPVIDNGLDWIDEEARDNGSEQIFLESILNYKIAKMNEIATERVELDKENKENKENLDEITDDQR